MLLYTQKARQLKAELMGAAVGKDKVANVLLPQRARGGANSALLAAQEIARSSAREVLSPLLDTACARLSAVLRRAFDIAVDSASQTAEGAVHSETLSSRVRLIQGCCPDLASILKELCAVFLSDLSAQNAIRESASLNGFRLAECIWRRLACKRRDIVHHLILSRQLQKPS